MLDDSIPPPTARVAPVRLILGVRCDQGGEGEGEGEGGGGGGGALLRAEEKGLINPRDVLRQGGERDGMYAIAGDCSRVPQTKHLGK